jgi:hypothetical protein
MKKLLILTVAAVACFMVGCGGGTDDYFPMSVGSQWDYEGYVLFGTTTAAMDTQQTMTVTTEAQAKTTLTSGEEVIPFQSTVITHQFLPSVMTDTTIGTSYSRESGDAILQYDSLSTSIPDTLLKMPLSEGDTWYVASNAKALVVGKEDVTVPAGTYKNTWKIKITSSGGGYTMDMFFWYAKGVGSVKTHYENTYGGYTSIFNQELKSVDIK